MYKNIWRAIVLVYRLDKKKFIINYTLFIAEALVSVLGIYLLQMFLEVLNTYLKMDTTLLYLFGIFILFLISKVAFYLLRAFGEYYCEIYSLIIMKKIKKIMQDKKIAPIHYEEKTFLDLQNQANIASDRLVYAVDTYADLIFMYGSELIFLSVYLYFIHPALVTIVIFILVIQFFNDARGKKLNNDLEVKIKNLRRKKETIVNLFLKKEVVKEIRVLNTEAFIIQRLETVGNLLKKLEKKFNHLLFIKNIRYGTIKLCIYIFSFSILYFYKTHLSIAQFSALFLVMESIFKLVEGGFERMENINQYLPQLEPFFKFLDYEEAQKENIESEKIILEKVDFQYPNSTKKALENISLVLEPNEKVGIVGRNGSGKSTLVKIIAGIYEPTNGSIQRKEVSMVMQDFMKYELSAIDNVAVGQITKEVDKTQFSKIDFQIEDYDKIISKEFSDIDLSQGQWQKLAILRGLHKESEYLIFDEPTWAIDPFVEKKVFDYLKQEVTQGMLIVTHNLTSLQMMDKILVLDEGKIVGFDTHKKLLETNKWYQSLWNSSETK